MSASPIRLLVAEDSAYMLMAIRTMMKLDPRIEIVGEARNGSEAVELARTLRPDIITMDVNMPELNGIQATMRIMADTPTTIVMLSSMTDRGVAITQQALLAGAVDYLPKSMSALDVDIGTIAAQFAAKVSFWGASAKTISRYRFSLPQLRESTDVMFFIGGYGSALVIAQVLKTLGSQQAPVLIQLDELSADNSASYIDFLSRELSRPVLEGRHRSMISPGTVTVVPGGRQVSLRSTNGSVMINLRDPNSTVDLLARMCSAFHEPAFIFLSGNDHSLNGINQLEQANGLVLVQPLETCVRADLPKSVLSQSRAANPLPYEKLPSTMDKAA